MLPPEEPNLSSFGFALALAINSLGVVIADDSHATST